VFGGEGVDQGAIGVDAFETGQRAGGGGSSGRSAAGGVRVVAIRTSDVARGVDRVFGGIMNAGGEKDGMRAEFVKLTREVLGGNGAVVARETILFLVGEIQQARPGAGRMRRVTILAGIGGDGGVGGMRPGIDAGAVPGLVREPMG